MNVEKVIKWENNIYLSIALVCTLVQLLSEMSANMGFFAMIYLVMAVMLSTGIWVVILFIRMLRAKDKKQDRNSFLMLFVYSLFCIFTIYATFELGISYKFEMTAITVVSLINITLRKFIMARFKFPYIERNEEREDVLDAGLDEY